MRAWLLTGPLGHLAAGLADWAELLTRWWWSRTRRRIIARWRALLRDLAR